VRRFGSEVKKKLLMVQIVKPVNRLPERLRKLQSHEFSEKVGQTSAGMV